MSKIPVVSSITPQIPLIDKSTGMVSFTWIKWFQAVQQIVNNSFDQQGNFDGNLGADATVGNRTAPILLILQNIDDTGIVTAQGIDFARSYVNKDTDHINDGDGSPLAGGKVAFGAFVSSAPDEGQILVFDGTDWLPHAKATTISKEPHKWLDSFNDASGAFTQSQPALTDISGVPPFPVTSTPATHQWLASYDATTGAFTQSQPAFADISGTIATSQLPGINATITTAALTPGGTQGSMTFTKGVLTAQTPAT
jgi:hypothetical protein